MSGYPSDFKRNFIAGVFQLVDSECNLYEKITFKAGGEIDGVTIFGEECSGKYIMEQEGVLQIKYESYDTQGGCSNYNSVILFAQGIPTVFEVGDKVPVTVCSILSYGSPKNLFLKRIE